MNSHKIMFLNKVLFQIQKLNNYSYILNALPNAVFGNSRVFFTKHSKSSKKITKEFNIVTGELKSRKSPHIPKITLIHEENVQVVTKEEGQRIADGKKLKMVKIVDLDTHSKRPVYKLMSSTEYYEEDLKQRERKKIEKSSAFLVKTEKLLEVNDAITDHDFEHQILRAVKWVQKKHPVRITVALSGNGTRRANQMVEKIEDRMKLEQLAYKVNQKQTTQRIVKCSIVPIPKKDVEEEDDTCKHDIKSANKSGRIDTESSENENTKCESKENVSENDETVRSNVHH